MTPYRHYLAYGLLPEEPTEAKIVKKNAGRYTLVDGKLFRHGYTHPILVEHPQTNGQVESAN